MAHALRLKIQGRTGAALQAVGGALLLIALIAATAGVSAVAWPHSALPYAPTDGVALLMVAYGGAVPLCVMLGLACVFLGEAVLTVTGLEWIMRRRRSDAQ
jgi:hypothetical protein